MTLISPSGKPVSGTAKTSVHVLVVHQPVGKPPQKVSILKAEVDTDYQATRQILSKAIAKTLEVLVKLKVVQPPGKVQP